MAHSASMGPPLSPRETRRSVRRSAPSISASTSKSPDSDQPPREKQRTTSSSSRNKRLKQEDHEDPPEDQKIPQASSTISSGSNSGVNGKAKRRAKEKDKEKEKEKDKDKDKQGATNNNQDADSVSVDLPPMDYNDEDDQGITRCVCGSTEDDPDAGEFMVQCETCKVWQHGLCMGYLSEDQVHDDDYYCEQCRPDLHVDLLKKVNRRPARQTSATSRSDHPSNSRVSRSHSPSHLSKQASKRRNTMNSRDAAFDESLKEIIEATAAEAAAVHEANSTERTSHPPESDILKKKRKRSAEDLSNKKRTRSASPSSDRQSVPPVGPETAPLPALPKATTSKQKRAGGTARKTTGNDALPVEPDEAAPAPKRQNSNARPKGSSAPKRPPLSHSISHVSAPVTQEHAPKRNQASGTSAAADARAYRNTHAYAVSQQTLFTSWNLPDYLSHLEHILPTDVPQPLEVRSSIATSGVNTSRADSTDRTMERGVKVKWPAKRMSVGDMNKRVRALVEWVGREQASALDRGRRRQALEVALKEQIQPEMVDGTSDSAMDVDQSSEAQSSAHAKGMPQLYPSVETSGQTMKMMEELMEELIGFQERFGPGAKSRDRRINVNS
ncbi:hypothetical protein CVT24_003954 [Panaeolus cyanescens]|uniref:PHD-type domain-containing protein n=1 Tax=Panaeolus cyanescens TaxID=181874 RepID=A0A409Y6Q2_9AGAR|nr:hypothetical protein CVT24_003954 [Panaeolus cyanescens]